MQNCKEWRRQTYKLQNCTPREFTFYYVTLKLNPRNLAGASICLAVMEQNSFLRLTLANQVMWKCSYKTLWNLGKPLPIYSIATHALKQSVLKHPVEQ
jgi:hypothetical protein